MAFVAPKGFYADGEHVVFVEALTRRPLCGRSSEHLKRGNVYDWVRDGSCLTSVSRSFFPVPSSIFLLPSFLIVP